FRPLKHLTLRCRPRESGDPVFESPTFLAKQQACLLTRVYWVPAFAGTTATISSVVVLVIMLAAMHGLTVRAREQVPDTGLVGPIFPGPPGFGRIGAVAFVARVDLALRQIFDLTAQHLGTHQRARVARQIDREPHHLDQRSRRRRKAVAAHQRDAVLAQAFGEVTS